MSKELDEAQAALAESIAEIKSMVASHAWGRYSGLMEAQIQGRIDSIILTPLERHDQTLMQEYAKGEIAGIKLAINLLPSLIDNMEHDYAQAENERSPEK